VTFEYATPGASWDELACEEKNRWRNIALPPGSPLVMSRQLT
jgi:hypothetical protein